MTPDAEQRYRRTILSLYQQLHDAHDVLCGFDISGGLIPIYNEHNDGSRTLRPEWRQYVANWSRRGLIDRVPPR